MVLLGFFNGFKWCFTKFYLKEMSFLNVFDDLLIKRLGATGDSEALFCNQSKSNLRLALKFFFGYLCRYHKSFLRALTKRSSKYFCSTLVSGEMVRKWV